MTKAKGSKKKKVITILAIVVVILALIELVAIGILGGIGPLGFLRGVMQGRMEGNRSPYSFDLITPLEDSPLEGRQDLRFGFFCGVRRFIPAGRGG